MGSRAIPKHVLDQIDLRGNPFPKKIIGEITLSGNDVGYIYIIEPNDGNSGIKIGRTKNLTERIYQHRRYWPNLKLFGYIKVLNCVQFEKKLHTILSPYEVPLYWDEKKGEIARQKERFSLTQEEWGTKVERQLNKLFIQECYLGPMPSLQACKPFGAYNQKEIELYWVIDKYFKETSKLRTLLSNALFNKLELDLH